MPPQKFLEHTVILCFKRRFSKENSVIRLISNILAPPNKISQKNFWLATPLHYAGVKTEQMNHENSTQQI